MSQNPLLVLFELFVMVLTISLHDATQSWAADRLGDPTARMLGRTTMNPVKHFSVWGMVISPLLSIFIFPSLLPYGWGQPVPMTYRNFPKKNGEYLAVLSGPVAQFAAAVVALIVLIATSFAVELWLSHPSAPDIALGFIPRLEVLRDHQMLYIAISILGATVMPHNLYLHSSIVQTRKYGDTTESRAEAIHFASIDSAVALMFALFINAAILVMAAATFHGTGHQDIADIGDAYQLLSPLLGTTMASALFAIALLCSGQNATLTGTLAGQIVMEGFINLRIRPWLRRLITRIVAIIPAIIVVQLYGERGTGPLIIFSQVILSLQLPFAVFPLVMFTSDRHKMGTFVNPGWLKVLAWTVAVIIAILNAWLLYQTIVGL